MMSIFNKFLVGTFCSIFALSPVLSFAQPANDQDKTIRIYNNSNETIYPVVEISIQPPGQEIANIYRMYINARTPGSSTKTKQTNQSNTVPKITGIPSGPIGQKGVIVTLPPNLPPPNSDSNWWNGGRVYIYDQPPPTPASDVVAGNFQGIPIYLSHTGFALEDPYQLVEYTFTQNQIDYDISYVDHLYLPIAVEVNDGGTDGSVGYNGTDMDIPSFQSHLVNFTNFQNWPRFNLPNQVNNPNFKIPGGYNAFALDQAPTLRDPNLKVLISNPNPKQIDQMVQKWKLWTDKNSSICGTSKDPYNDPVFCKAFQQDAQTVWGAFQQNAADQKISNPSDQDIAKHIVGYVGFPDKDGNPSDLSDLNKLDIDKKWIALAEGLYYSTDRTVTNSDTYKNRKYPTYDSPYNLLPFVSFVHKEMDMNVYAFSIDDLVGNVQEDGNGFTIAVAGLNGIANKTKYVAPSSYQFHVAYGQGSTPETSWTSLTVCGQNYSNIQKPGAKPITQSACDIQIAAQDKQQVSLKTLVDSNQNLTIVPGSCNDTTNQLCSNGQVINDQIRVDPTGTTVNFPQPSSVTPPVNAVVNLNWGPGWKNVVINQKSFPGQNPNDPNAGYFAPVAGVNGKADIQMSADQVTLNMTVLLDANGLVSSIDNCGGALCSQVSVTADNKYINVPPATSPTPPSDSYVYWPPGLWSSLNACGTNVDFSKNPGSYPINDGCKIEFQSSQGSLTFTVNKTGANWAISNCGGALSKLCPQVSPGATNVNVPGPQ